MNRYAPLVRDPGFRAVWGAAVVSGLGDRQPAVSRMLVVFQHDGIHDRRLLLDDVRADLVEHLNGMFAFAVWDERDRTFFFKLGYAWVQ